MRPRKKLGRHEEELAAYAHWEWNYAQVEAFVLERGHCNLGEHPAGEWLRMQVRASVGGKLSPDRQQRLAGLGVSLATWDEEWSARLNQIRDVLARCAVPRKQGREKWLPEPLDGTLAAWMREQRVLFNEEQLRDDRLRKLRALKLLPNRRATHTSRAFARAPGADSKARRDAVAWEIRLAQLAAYQGEHGDCDVPKLWPENQSLANWVRFQRKQDHLNRLSEEYRSRLDALGFPWSTRGHLWDKLWEKRFQETVRFKQEYGHTRVPKSFHKQLWHWRHVQREFRRKGILKPERVARLNAIGFEWEEDEVWGRTWDEPKERRWDARLQQLADYIAAHGHGNVPSHGKEYPALGAWLNRQRMDSRMGALRPDRLARLHALGFEAMDGRPSPDEGWEQRFRELADFYRQHGHTRVTGAFEERLSEWRYLQRANHRKGSLSAERIARLDAIGFEWVGPESSGLTQQERWDRQWLLMYDQLVQFHGEHGHCHVTRNSGSNPRLAEWVQDQRALRCQGKLRLERYTRLQTIGFLWSAENIDRDARWERRFQQLCNYRHQHSHTRVPKSFDKQLWHWRHVQREFRRKGTLGSERSARLEAIGFEWEERGKPWAKSREDRWDRTWDEMFARLVEFQCQHGTTHVIAGRPENARLATWVGDQRERHRHGGLRPDRMARLDALGFEWRPGRPTLAALWDRRYAELIAFQMQHGHTRVPKSFDKQLWHWRHVQREFRKKNELSAERIARLETIGFEWTGRDPVPQAQPERPVMSQAEDRDARWTAKLERLAAFIRTHGHAKVSAKSKNDPQLGQWVSDQRKLRKRGKLPPERQQRLESLGLIWEPR